MLITLQCRGVECIVLISVAAVAQRRVYIVLYYRPARDLRAKRARALAYGFEVARG